jgi:polar amino acid transport system substrate-binding protein
MRRYALAVAVAVAGMAAVTTAVTSAAQIGAAIQPPPAIAKAGKIVYCIDATYPPEEYFQGSKIIGSDVDFGTAIAKLMGVGAQFKNTVFDSIIPALLTKKCDAIISGMNDTAERRKQVDFVDYLKVGQTLMVKKGNPGHVTSIASLSGKRVSVESGTTNRDYLVATSKKLQKQGKKPITIVTFPKDTDSVAALKAGRVDAYFGDTPPVLYHIKHDPSLAVGVSPISPIPIGVALRKNDPLRAATQKAINAMYASGTIKRILARWEMSKAVRLLR